MKTYIIAVLSLLICSCSGSEDFSDMNTSATYSEAMQVLSQKEGASMNVDLSKYKSLLKLKPENAYTTDEGVFIVTGSFLWNESGVFIPRQGVSVNTDVGNDPSFTLIENGVYIYSIKG